MPKFFPRSKSGNTAPKKEVASSTAWSRLPQGAPTGLQRSQRAKTSQPDWARNGIANLCMMPLELLGPHNHQRHRNMPCPVNACVQIHVCMYVRTHACTSVYIFICIIPSYIFKMCRHMQGVVEQHGHWPGHHRDTNLWVSNVACAQIRSLVSLLSCRSPPWLRWCPRRLIFRDERQGHLKASVSGLALPGLVRVVACCTKGQTMSPPPTPHHHLRRVEVKVGVRPKRHPKVADLGPFSLSFDAKARRNGRGYCERKRPAGFSRHAPGWPNGHPPKPRLYSLAYTERPLRLVLGNEQREVSRVPPGGRLPPLRANTAGKGLLPPSARPACATCS